MKEKNYKLRSRVYKLVGSSLTCATTIGGFIGYESAIDWENFKNDLENFVVVNESVKVNLAIAFPVLVAILVFIWVYRKKNEEALKGKIAMPLLFGIIILWLLYSIIEATLFAMIGAFVGSLADEVIFSPLSLSCKTKVDEKYELELEEKKEKIREKTRKQTNGTV